MRSWVFVFPFAGFVKQLDRAKIEVPKTIGTIDVSRLSCTPT
jgi:hypothetical protein